MISENPNEEGWPEVVTVKDIDSVAPSAPFENQMIEIEQNNMLSIDNLHAQVEGKGILNGINLDIKPGEVHAIMGPNGSGKSTLSTVIAGHEDYEVTKGSLLYQGADISDLSADERAHLGIFLSFQYPVEIPGVTVTNFIKTAINETRKGQGT